MSCTDEVFGKDNVWKAHAADVDWQGGRWAVERMEGQWVDLGAAEAERP